MEWRKIAVSLFIILAVVILFLSVYLNLWTFHDVAPYIISGLVASIPTGLIYLLRPSMNIRKTKTSNYIEGTQEQKSVNPILKYGKIIIRNETRGGHGGEYFYSKYFLEIINTVPNTLAHECEAFIDLQNLDLRHINAFWDRNDSEIISIGHKELVKLFTISKFKDDKNHITIKLLFYRKTSYGYLSYIPKEWDSNMNKRLAVPIQSSDANFLSDEIFGKTLLEITQDAVEE